MVDIALCLQGKKYVYTRTDKYQRNSKSHYTATIRRMDQYNVYRSFYGAFMTYVLFTSYWMTLCAAFLPNDSSQQSQVTRTRNSFILDIAASSNSKTKSIAQLNLNKKSQTCQSYSSCTSLKLSKDNGGKERDVNDILSGMNNFFKEIKEYLYTNLSGEKVDDENSNGVEYLGVDSKRIFSLPVKSIKPGGLRLFLSLHLISQQNTPEKGSWVTTQVSDNALLTRYKDSSGAVSIIFMDDKILVDRVGASPSFQYTMQEAVLLQGLLNELQMMAYDSEVDESDRLLVIDGPVDAIDQALDTLSFG